VILSPIAVNKCDSEGFFGNEQDCKKFFRCQETGNGNYIKYDFDCGPGTIYDTEMQTCNHPWVVRPSARGCVLDAKKPGN